MTTTPNISRIGKSVAQVANEYFQAGIDPGEHLAGDLVCIVSECYGRSKNSNYISLEAGSVIMLLSTEFKKNTYTSYRPRTSDSVACKLLYKDGVVLVEFPEKLFYLEHGTALKDLTFCITGKLTHARDYYASMISFQQGKFKKNINKDLDYLVYGKDVGATKTTKARQHGVKMITEAELLALVLKNKAKQENNA